MKLQSRHATRRLSRAFTLIELLVVILILAILMSVAMPAYLSSTKNAMLRACQANMQTIANAVYANKVTLRSSDFSGFMGAVAVDSAHEPDLGAVPVCPNNGTYTIEQQVSGNNSSFRVRCSKDGTYTPGTIPS